MTVSQVTTGGLPPGTVGEPWVLVLGGVTAMGNRRARRAVSDALAAGFEVVWFDGFDYDDSEVAEQPASGASDQERLHIVRFAEAEAATMASRLRSGKPFQTNRVLRAIWKHVLRRVGAMLRARACWTTVRPEVKLLAEETPPTAIVCGDDYSITSAWYASRIWPGAPVSTQLVVNHR